MECDYTLSSISNSGSFMNYPMINKKQILLDWINTINEPTCLLVSNLNDLKDGKVFVEILKHYLYMYNNKQLLYEFFSNDINSSHPEQKIKLVLEILVKISEGDERIILNKFYKIIPRIFKDEEMLLEFVSVLREIYEKNLTLNPDDLANSKCRQEEVNEENNQNMYIEDLQNEKDLINSKNLKSNQSQEHLEKYNASNNYCNYVNQINLLNTINSNNSSRPNNKNYCSNKQYNFNKEFISTQNKGNQNKKCTNENVPAQQSTINEPFQQEFEIDQTNYDNSMQNHHMAFPFTSQGSTITSNYHTQTTNGKNNLFTSPFECNNQARTMDTPKNYQEMSPQFQILSTNKKEEPAMQITHSNNLSISPSKQQSFKPMKRKTSYTTNNSNTNISFTTSNNDNSFCFMNDASKTYSKKKKAIINMTRGIIYINNKMCTIDYSMFKLKYAKFLKPTDPIIEINYNNIKKYNVLSKIDDLEKKPKKQNENNDIYPPTPSKKPSMIRKEIRLTTEKKKMQSQIHQLSQPYTSSNLQEASEDGVNIGIKSRIYYWLIDLGIIKEKMISINNLPNICINGVLFCDLVNRCEGRVEKIKGIIRKTTTKSQIQVNINKVLEFLRSIEKFSSKYLWSGNDIAKGNREVIWGLLDDLCYFYAKQKTFNNNTHSTNTSFRRSKSKPQFKSSKTSNSFSVKNNQSKQKETETFFDESINSYTNNFGNITTNTNRDFNISNISNVNNNTSKKHSVFFNSTNPNQNIINHITHQEESEMFTISNYKTKPIKHKDSYSKTPQNIIIKRIPKPKNQGMNKRIQSVDKIKSAKNISKDMNYSNFLTNRHKGTYSNQMTSGNSTKSFIIF